EVAAIDVLDVDLGAGVERLVVGPTGHDVLELGAHERAALARLDVLELHDGPELSVEIQDDAVLDVCGGCHAGMFRFVEEGAVRTLRQAQGSDRGRPTVDSTG